jgi:hypothetical protein
MEACGYEGSTTLITPTTPHSRSMLRGRYHAVHPDWYQTERAFYEAHQDGSYQHAV